MITRPTRCGIGSRTQSACGFPEVRSGCLPKRWVARRALIDAMSDSVVVVGNGVSGYACAARLAERGVAVKMIGPGLPHDRPPLSKRALLTGRPPLLADAAQLFERGIEHID